MKFYQLVVILNVLALASCSQSTTPTTLSPWHSLTAAEINEASTAVSEAVGPGIIFNRISLTEPDKTHARSWEAGNSSPRSADVVYRSKKTTFLVRYDLATASLSK